MLSWIVLLVLCLALLVSVYGASVIGSGIYLSAHCRLDTDEKVLALTFDDGPHPEFTPRVLDVLADYGIEAAFFCIGQEVERCPELVRRIQREGHLIGNHSYTHANHLPLFRIPRMEEDFLKCSKAIGSITGNAPLWFRPPFGVSNPNIASVVKKMQLRVMGWSLRSFDGSGKNAEKVIRRVQRKLKPGSIILLHDKREDSERIVRAIVEYALAQGYCFVRADKYIKG